MVFIPPTDPEPEPEAAPEPEPEPEPVPEPEPAPNPDEPEISVWNSATGVTDTMASPFSRQYTLQEKKASADLGAVPDDLGTLPEQSEQGEKTEQPEQRAIPEPSEPLEEEEAVYTREDVEKAEPENVGVMVRGFDCMR